MTLEVLHELIANDSRTFDYVLRFLNEGHFVAADQRQPILEELPTQRSTRPTDRSATQVTRREAAYEGAGEVSQR